MNFLATFVPALIAFAMVGAALYLIITGNPVPDFLVNSLTMIMGYYFGIGITQSAREKGG